MRGSGSRMKTGAVRTTAAAACSHASISGGREKPTLTGDRLPVAEPSERVPDHAALVGNRGPAVLALERLANRLGEPGAAADIESVGVRVLRECRTSKFVGKLHVIGGRDLLKLVGPHHLGGDACDRSPAAREEIRER